MCDRVTWISDEKVRELFEELADLRERVKTEYQRGREDAAKAVEATPYMTNVVPSGWTDETWRGYRPDAIDRDIAIAAARGDGLLAPQTTDHSAHENWSIPDDANHSGTYNDH